MLVFIRNVLITSFPSPHLSLYVLHRFSKLCDLNILVSSVKFSVCDHCLAWWRTRRLPLNQGQLPYEVLLTQLYHTHSFFFFFLNLSDQFNLKKSTQSWVKEFHPPKPKIYPSSQLGIDQRWRKSGEDLGFYSVVFLIKSHY